MNFTNASLLLSVITALLVGCSTPVPAPSPEKAAAAPTSAAPAKPVQPSATAASTVTPVVVAAYLDPKNVIHNNRSVYFDFGNYQIMAADQNLIEQHGKYLASHIAVAIKIEGNADERGSSEYNLALGQKRAQTVLTSLKNFGAKDSQMEAVSWGKEKPKALGHDEAAWAQNRRADLVYPVK
jgi:peptidoglycan-associated lipoprotein